jgi:hypothetical protein
LALVISLVALVTSISNAWRPVHEGILKLLEGRRFALESGVLNASLESLPAVVKNTSTRNALVDSVSCFLYLPTDPDSLVLGQLRRPIREANYYQMSSNDVIGPFLVGYQTRSPIMLEPNAEQHIVFERRIVGPARNAFPKSESLVENWCFVTGVDAKNGSVTGATRISFSDTLDIDPKDLLQHADYSGLSELERRELLREAEARLEEQH